MHINEEWQRTQMDKNSPDNTPRPAETGQLLFIVVLLLALGGLGVSIELTNIHHATHTDPTFSSVCAVSDEVNCETVARSPFSIFLGAPVSVWGILGYTLIALFTLWGFARSKFHERYPLGIISGLVAAAFGAAGLLAYISFTRIDSLCLFCMSLYGINTTLLAILAGYCIRKRLNPFALFFDDMRALLGRPALFAGIAVPTLGVTVALMFAITPYWQHVGWQELPKLPTGNDGNDEHWIGAESPMVTIIEFSDYQCPFCRRAHHDLRTLAGQYPDEVRVIHRHLPLDQACNKDIKRPFHTEACKFAKAAECAAEQEKFWPMNDALFSIQDSMKATDVDVEILAVELGLDRSSFKDCMASSSLPKRIVEGMKAAKKLDVHGTPTFFIGSQPYEGKIPPIAIKSAVEKARGEKKKGD